MRKTRWIVILTAALLVALGAQVAATAQATAPPNATATAPSPQVKSPFPNDTDTFSYIMGYSLGKRWKQTSEQNGFDINANLMAQSLKDGINDAPPKMTPEEMRAFMLSFQRTIRAKAQALADKNLAAGKKFLQEMAAKPGVKTFPSGLEYKVLKAGTGPSPTASDKVSVKYEGRLPDGTIFDSTAKHGGKPFETPVTGVIPGWTEALEHMKVGGKWEVYIPADLAYGQHSPPGIPPNSPLVFNIELLKIIPSQTVQVPKVQPPKSK